MATPIPEAPVIVQFPEPQKEPLRTEEIEAEPEPITEPEVVPEPVPEVKVEVEPEATCSVVSSPILNDLWPVDRLLITRRLRVKGVLFLRGKKNRFFIRTPDQNLIYTVEEENSWWVGYFCYGLRPLQLRVLNSQGTEVMRINRPYAFTTRVLPCQLQRLQVFSPPGHLIGSVQQKWSAIKPVYMVKNIIGEIVFWIQGPACTLSLFRDIQFQILRPDGTPVGATCKRWEGLMHALFFSPVTDRCGVAFEKNLKSEEKALLMAVTLLLEYMYYDV